MSHRGGGADAPLAASRMCLNRFCMNQAPPVKGRSPLAVLQVLLLLIEDMVVMAK